jgi:hypothetical protein
VLTGCMGGAMVKKDGVAAAGRIAMVSVVMPRIADTSKESNRNELRSFAEEALGQVYADLKTVRNWSVVDPATYKGTATVLSMDAFSDEEIAALIPAAAERKAARDRAGTGAMERDFHRREGPAGRSAFGTGLDPG